MSKDTFFESIPVAELIERGLAGQAGTLVREPKVLVVDDEIVIADTLTAILNNEGYSASSAYDAKQALEIATANPPDLLITDVCMPGMNGIDLAIAIRKSFPNCRIMLFSGNAATTDLLDAARAKGHRFHLVSKPVHPLQLLQEIVFLGVRRAVKVPASAGASESETAA